MRVTIDSSGRMVVPKALREAIGLGDGGDADIHLSDGSLIVSAPTVRKRIEQRDGRATIVADEPLPPLSDDVVRETLDSVRR